MRAVYLNNAATAWPKAPGVAEAVAGAIDRPPIHPGRTPFGGPDPMATCRRALARLLGVPDPARIVLTSNATASLNLAILGLGLRRGDHVVTTVTEHNSVLRPLEHLRLSQGITVTYVGLTPDGALDAEAFLRALEQGAKVAAVNHGSNVTGRVNDVAELFGQARHVGAVTILDASQTMGHLPVRPLELGADVVAFTGHKGLLGPAGTGGLYVSPELELRQVVVGGTGVRSDLATHPEEMPTRLEAGTPAMPAFAGLAAALEWRESHGAEWELAARRSAEALRAGLRAIGGVSLVDDDDQAPRTGVVSLRASGWDVEELGYVLVESFGIHCRTGLHCAPLIHEAIGTAPDGTLRLSVSGFTSEEDVLYALSALGEISR